MIEIRVPKLNNNDATYVLLEWAAKDGQEVRPGDPLASVETSKAVEELEAEEGGILRHRLAEGDTCAPGQVIAWLLAPGEEPPSDDDSGTRLDGASGDETTAEEDIVITEPARRLMEERGISMERVRALGKKGGARTVVSGQLSVVSSGRDTSEVFGRLPGRAPLGFRLTTDH